MSETVLQTKEKLDAFIKETNPTADIGPGTVLSELLSKGGATLQNPIKNDISALASSNTVAAALSSATDTYNPIIDNIASNYGTARNQGKKSIGKLKITVFKNRNFAISNGFVFYNPVLKLNYLVTSAVSVVPTVKDPASEVQLFSENGLFYFILPVEAAQVGSQYQVSDQANFSLGATNTLPNFVNAKAYGNFVSGLPIETDKQLIARFQSSLTNKTLLTSKSILARLKDLYPNTQAISVIGAGDMEMNRDKQNLFGISTLGMTDVYVRTTFGPETRLITKEATKTGNTWSFTLGAGEFSGFYRVVSVIPSGKQLIGSIIHSETFSYSTVGLTKKNQLNNATEARFTKYQTCTVSFAYDGTTETTATFDVLLAGQPDITEIQDIFLSSAERIACADYLIKSAIPCYVTVNLKVHKKTNLTVLPIENIKQDIYNYINSKNFQDDVNVSEIIDICHNYDIRNVELPVTLTGDIYTNQSTVLTITDKDVLAIPTNLDLGVSKNTTIFMIDYFKSSASSASNLSSFTDAISIEVT
jgi:hypothetical protein